MSKYVHKRPGLSREASGQCDRCQQEIYADDLVHVIDGYVVCPECFDDFVFDYFIANMCLGSELKEVLDQ